MMGLFAIGDLHLSHDREKPMDIFGTEWVDHSAKIAANWNEIVTDKDLVLVAGDISWAMHLEEAQSDLQWLARLRGTKVIVRGNHDYWWNSISKVRALLPDNIHALQNDSFPWKDYVICGARGWTCPGDSGFEDNGNLKIYNREVQRLKLSLESAAVFDGKKIIVLMHFPPFNRQSEPSGFTKIMEDYGVHTCVFGHIHDRGRDYIFQGERNNVRYRFVAADGIGFTPLRLF